MVQNLVSLLSCWHALSCSDGWTTHDPMHATLALDALPHHFGDFFDWNARHCAQARDYLLVLQQEHLRKDKFIWSDAHLLNLCDIRYDLLNDVVIV